MRPVKHSRWQTNSAPAVAGDRAPQARIHRHKPNNKPLEIYLTILLLVSLNRQLEFLEGAQQQQQPFHQPQHSNATAPAHQQQPEPTKPNYL
jgi:hypothetical protein